MYVNLTIIGVLLIMQTNTIVKADPPIPAAVSAVSPYSSLIVSSKAGLFRVEADHADVQSVIKQLFEKGDRQFNLENGLTGIVTLRLTEQPLRVILDEICRQTFIQYHFDATTGIYRFERNQQALRAAIMRLQSLNSLVRQQLGMMGLNINPVSVHSLSELPTASAGNKIPAAGSGLGGGGNAFTASEPSP